MPTRQRAAIRLLVIVLCLMSSGIVETLNAQRRGRRQRPSRAGQQASNSAGDKKADEDKKPKVDPTLPQSVADETQWRSVGPANMGGRITALAVYEKDPSMWWAATASGGLLKTTNNGRTLEHQFDDQNTVSIGDVQVAQSNPDIVWVGTGESNPRNSVSWGDGVYKSTDGGKTWKNMGLKKSFQIGALAIHPKNPDVVWVGALGRLWGPNEERGLFKTTDGGKNWKKVLFVDDKTGIIDVQVDPKNPNNLLIATYERKRDGFDGNDPVQRFGDGSGIYKSTDGGDSFKRITEGLPSCKMGRIGLDYFEDDTNVVVAIIESEKIAKRPDTSPYLGIRGENADVGARMTDVTRNGPAEKAGFKNDDIVVAIDDNIVMSYNDFLGEVRKHQAGETIKVVVSRERKQVELEVKLAKRPRTNRRSTRNEFTGTLGGQAANLQGQQGKGENDYGGVYLSEDGGSSWKRINTLNPRPMYYSNIQIDPVDRNNIYICGTSLYKSKDGGETFTGDGGSDGIHTDHHALWIDKRDSRHMILGSDGGLYVTQDRMEHWDHLNHVAIGQFYHVGIDSTMDYKVYGGLQDNGSWGGPSRGKNGTGPVNSDWMRVGGGDGFITLVDANDPNQIYFESQNGGMGRIHIESGERGFIRPRPPRGTRYRFNWKTPFLLSPHNSKVHYSAGNYVFRSFDRGNDTKAISPEITNSNRGAGSAISESPVQPGLIYVGTTDGAVWKTEDGGNNWTPLFYQSQKDKPKDDKEKDDKEKDDKDKDDKDKDGKKGDDDSAKSETKKEETDSDKGKAKSEDKKKSTDDPVSGKWSGQLISDRIPEDRAGFSFELKLDGTKVSGSMAGRRGSQDITGEFDPETGEISMNIETGRGSREYSGKIDGKEMNGEMSGRGGRFQVDFSATRDDGKTENTETDLDLSRVSLRRALIGVLYLEDSISGEWTGVIEDENLPGGSIEFTLELKKDDKNQLTGGIVSPQGDSEIVDGRFDPENNKVIFEAENENFGIEIDADVKGTSMSGSISINGGVLVIDFEATKKASEESEKQEEKKSSEAKQEKSDKPKASEEKTKDSESGDKARSQDKTSAAEKSDANEEPKAGDLVSGQWEGNMVSPRGAREMKLALNLKSNTEITGTFESAQGEREISGGKFDPESKTLTLYSETDQFTLAFDGTVEGDQYEGEIDINDGRFTMEFELTRKSKEAPAKTDEPKKESAKSQTKSEYKQPTGEKSLSKLMPGPRWVSSIEASKFKKERCYITFDGHRSNDDDTHVFVTNDSGKTWQSLKNNLPETAGSARVLREDTKNENLLFLGCEFSAWYSIDQGKTWTRIKGGLPTVAVHEFAIHDKRAEIVAATHGRSLWIADISILRQMSPSNLAADAHLFQPHDAIVWSRKPGKGSSGTRRFVGTNPTRGTNVAYSLGKNARNVTLTLKDLMGDTVKTFEASTRKGFHQVRWDLTRDTAGGAGQQGRRRRFSPSVPTGKYLLTLSVDGEREQKIINVIGDPDGPASSQRAEVEDALFGY